MPRPERHYAHTGKGISVYTPWGIKREHIEAGSEQAQALEQNRLRRLVLHPKPCALVIAHLSSRICHCHYVFVIARSILRLRAQVQGTPLRMLLAISQRCAGRNLGFLMLS